MESQTLGSASVTAPNSGTAWVGSVGWRSLGLPYRRLSCPSQRSAPAFLCHQLLSLSLCDPLGSLYRETGLCHARGQRIGGKVGRSLLGSIAQSPPIPGAEAGRGWGLHSHGPRRSLALLGSPKARACTQEMQPQRVGPRAGMGPTCLGCRYRRPYSPIRYGWPRYSKFPLQFLPGGPHCAMCWASPLGPQP